jgi:multiple sugar transport system substrate-binding protein
MKVPALFAFAILSALPPVIASADPITIQVSYSSGAYSSVLMESKRAFEATRPDIKISYRGPVVNTYDELLQTTLRSAAIGDLPDISLEGSQNVGILANRGIPITLDGLISGEAAWRDLGYSPSMQEVGQIGGKTYALAYATSVPTIYVNLDLLKKAGVDTANLPSDWTALSEAASKVQKLGGSVVGGLFDYYSTGNWTFQALITSQGGEILTADGAGIAFNSPQGLRALAILRTFGAAGTVDMTQSQMLQAFAAGTVGIFASYSAAIGQIEQQIAGKFQMRAAPWPILSENGRVPAGGRTVMIYAKDASKQKAAWEYVKFLTGAIGQTILVKGVGAVPVNRRAVDDPNLLGKFYDENPNQRAALAAVPRLTKWLSYPGANSVKISEIIRDQLRRALIRQEDPPVVMAEIVKQISPLLPPR